MPRYYCDYCDTYLTHDSPSVRKQHNAGYKHKANVRIYYQQFEEQQTQSIIDQRIKEHLGQTAAFQQVGAALQSASNGPETRLPVLPTPVMPMGGNNAPLFPGMRPPVLPRPMPGAPGYMNPPMMPPMMAPPGAPSLPGQMNGVPRPPTMIAQPTVPGSTAAPTPSGPHLWFHLLITKQIKQQQVEALTASM
ncbi:U1 small nuclear ribonucleoprotein C [Populus alba x Populus x berolinensis]|nr:U1 small nuclear ribonucleoprotein C [Populus alba x Populus x berolinensis]